MRASRPVPSERKRSLRCVGVARRRAVRRQVLLPRRARGATAPPRRLVPRRRRRLLLRRCVSGGAKCPAVIRPGRLKHRREGHSLRRAAPWRGQPQLRLRSHVLPIGKAASMGPNSGMSGLVVDALRRRPAGAGQDHGRGRLHRGAGAAPGQVPARRDGGQALGRGGQGAGGRRRRRVAGAGRDMVRVAGGGGWQGVGVTRCRTWWSRCGWQEDEGGRGWRVAGGGHDNLLDVVVKVRAGKGHMARARRKGRTTPTPRCCRRKKRSTSPPHAARPHMRCLALVPKLLRAASVWCGVERRARLACVAARACRWT